MLGADNFTSSRTLPMSISLRNIGGNALSILSSDVMNRATSFVLYAMVARHLGTFEFGQLSLAFSLFYVFQVSAVAGLKILIAATIAQPVSNQVIFQEWLCDSGGFVVCVGCAALPVHPPNALLARDELDRTAALRRSFSLCNRGGLRGHLSSLRTDALHRLCQCACEYR